MIISFAWTSGAVEDRTKTETRRFWSDEYAERVRRLKYHDAWTKTPIAGGRKICGIIVHSVEREPLVEMSEASYHAEGGKRYWPSREAYIEMMLAQNKGDTPWRVVFSYPED